MSNTHIMHCAPPGEQTHILRVYVGDKYDPRVTNALAQLMDFQDKSIHCMCSDFIVVKQSGGTGFHIYEINENDPDTRLESITSTFTVIRDVLYRYRSVTRGRSSVCRYDPLESLYDTPPSLFVLPDKGPNWTFVDLSAEHKFVMFFNTDFDIGPVYLDETGAIKAFIIVGEPGQPDVSQKVSAMKGHYPYYLLAQPNGAVLLTKMGLTKDLRERVVMEFSICRVPMGTQMTMEWEVGDAKDVGTYVVFNPTNADQIEELPDPVTWRDEQVAWERRGAHDVQMSGMRAAAAEKEEARKSVKMW